ncbi:MAG: sugar ABC transporter ATP-binding protein, partial [Acidobacteria bacterium]|nr:sugar ABC transporter ATP-binding protein [Acidobacteriota bacterium]
MTFPGVRALTEVNFDVYPGEVHALVGQNGAGKSTLIKILSGEITGYDGELRLDGRPVRFSSPAEGLGAGIAVIPQELQLVSTLTAADNIFLGREPRARFGFVDPGALAEQAEAAMSALDEAVPAGPVGALEAGQRQLITIARALSLNARLLIMDEPSSSLGPSEVRRLEQLVRDLAGRGVAVVYVSHRLDEIRRLATRVTVLRDGCHVATVPGEDVDEQELVRLMAGRAVDRVQIDELPADAAEVLRVEHLSLPDPARPGGFRLRDISLSVRRGEIVGLAVLIGAGRSDFLLALTGALDRRPDGRIVLNGAAYRPESPLAARRNGLVLLPEDRQALGIFPDLSVRTNVTISRLDGISRGWFVSREREAREACAVMADTLVRCVSPLVPIST